MRGGMVALLMACAATPATADVVFSNPYASGGSCSYNGLCGGNGYYAAQIFTLGGTTRLTGASVTNQILESEFGSPPASTDGPYQIQWQLYSADGDGGLPGTLRASGISDVTSEITLGSSSAFDGLIVYNQVEAGFALPSVTLAAGDYYLAVHALTDNSFVYLMLGTAPSGAAETMDGGQDWQAGYDFGGPSLAMTISGDAVTGGVPEPASWMLMTGGFAAAGATLRRKRIGRVGAAA